MTLESHLASQIALSQLRNVIDGWTHPNGNGRYKMGEKDLEDFRKAVRSEVENANLPANPADDTSKPEYWREKSPEGDDYDQPNVSQVVKTGSGDVFIEADSQRWSVPVLPTSPTVPRSEAQSYPAPTPFAPPLPRVRPTASTGIVRSPRQGLLKGATTGGTMAEDTREHIAIPAPNIKRRPKTDPELTPHQQKRRTGILAVATGGLALALASILGIKAIDNFGDDVQAGAPPLPTDPKPAETDSTMEVTDQNPWGVSTQQPTISATENAPVIQFEQPQLLERATDGTTILEIPGVVEVRENGAVIPILSIVESAPSMQNDRIDTARPDLDVTVDQFIPNLEFFSEQQIQSALSRLALEGHFHAWTRDNFEERSRVTFNEYLQMLSTGQDMSYQVEAVALSAENIASGEAPGTIRTQEMTVNPLAPVEYIFVGGSNRLPIKAADGSSYLLGVRSDGGVRTYIWMNPEYRMEGLLFTNRIVSAASKWELPEEIQRGGNVSDSGFAQGWTGSANDKLTKRLDSNSVEGAITFPNQ